MILTACSSADKAGETPEGLFAMAQEFENDERYDEAARRYQEVKNKFPYSNYALKAELAIADVYFKDEMFPEAQVAYQSFRELHPKHAQIDYVTFRIGLSFYKQLPESIDRDLALAKDAIYWFDTLVNEFPRSAFTQEARDKKTECINKLAEKESYIANFYFIREKYLSAFQRYENLIAKYPGHSEAEALSRAAISAHKISREDKSKYYMKLLREKYSNTKEYDNARKVIE